MPTTFADGVRKPLADTESLFDDTVTGGQRMYVCIYILYRTLDHEALV